MRTGKNPAKDSIHLESKYYHRVIVPVYIPNFDGYFKDAREILCLCLDSLVNTVHDRVGITVINNGCCTEIRSLLNDYFEAGRIDQVVHFQENKGKVDAIFSVANGSYEPLITISDSDVLFLPGWVTEVEGAIQVFPEIGLISPCPLPGLWNYMDSATLLGAMFTFNLQLKPLLREADLKMFQDSVNNPDMYKGKEMLLGQQLCISRKGRSVVIGAGHFVATLRREVFKGAPDKPSLQRIGSDSEHEYVDVSVDKLGFYRVGVSGIYAHHLGNTLEAWMEIEFEKTKSVQKPAALPFVPVPRRSVAVFIPYFLRKHLSLLLVSRIVRTVFFAFTGVGLRSKFRS